MNNNKEYLKNISVLQFRNQETVFVKGYGLVGTSHSNKHMVKGTIIEKLGAEFEILEKIEYGDDLYRRNANGYIVKFVAFVKKIV